MRLLSQSAPAAQCTNFKAQSHIHQVSGLYEFADDYYELYLPFAEETEVVLCYWFYYPVKNFQRQRLFITLSNIHVERLRSSQLPNSSLILHSQQFLETRVLKFKTMEMRDTVHVKKIVKKLKVITWILG